MCKKTILLFILLFSSKFICADQNNSDDQLQQSLIDQLQYDYNGSCFNINLSDYKEKVVFSTSSMPINGKYPKKVEYFATVDKKKYFKIDETEEMLFGNYRVDWNTSELKSGMYYIVIFTYYNSDNNRNEAVRVFNRYNFSRSITCKDTLNIAISDTIKLKIKQYPFSKDWGGIELISQDNKFVKFEKLPFVFNPMDSTRTYLFKIKQKSKENFYNLTARLCKDTLSFKNFTVKIKN